VDFAEAQAAAVAEVVLYTPARLGELLEGAGGPDCAGPEVLVTDETTQEAARRLAGEGDDPVVLLNFASARNPGGGFLNGAKAQEEDLCRCSGLYPTLVVDAARAYYAVNRAGRSLLYSDHMIYSPGVPFFRVKGTGELLDEPFRCAIITAPAPNAGPILQRDPAAGPAIAETFQRRWGQVLAIARDRGHRRLLLGAWGCGAFQNDPAVAAGAFASWLREARFAGAFHQVVFAIPAQGKRGRANHAAFRERLTSAG